MRIIDSPQSLCIWDWTVTDEPVCRVEIEGEVQVHISSPQNRIDTHDKIRNG